MERKFYKITAVLAFATTIALSSCSPKRTTTSGNTSSNVAVASSAAKTNKNTKTNSKSKKVEENKTLPRDRKALEVHSDPKAYTPEEFAKGVIKGDWSIDKVYKQRAVGEVAPYIKFSPSEGKIYGNNGCNTVNAEYSYNAKEHKIQFNNPLVTMRLCAMTGITDALINQALNETRRYELREENEDYVLTFFDSKGQEVMQLSHQNLDFLNGTWKVTAIDGEPIDIDKMKLVFDIDERKVHGNTGCNVLNGRLETDLDEPNTFSFEGMGVTMMMCPEIEYQTAMLVALEEACKAKPLSKNEVILLDASGNNVMTLERTSDR